MSRSSAVENIIVIYLNRIGFEFLPANFSLSYFDRQFLGSAHLLSPSIFISPINTTVPPIILQYHFGLKTIWINKGYRSCSPSPLFQYSDSWAKENWRFFQKCKLIITLLTVFEAKIAILYLQKSQH
jgi:hypothetical protein